MVIKCKEPIAIYTFSWGIHSLNQKKEHLPHHVTEKQVIQANSETAFQSITDRHGTVKRAWDFKASLTGFTSQVLNLLLELGLFTALYLQLQNNDNIYF